jgi:hypothetical protein
MPWESSSPCQPESRGYRWAVAWLESALHKPLNRIQDCSSNSCDHGDSCVGKNLLGGRPDFSSKHSLDSSVYHEKRRGNARTSAHRCGRISHGLRGKRVRVYEHKVVASAELFVHLGRQIRPSRGDGNSHNAPPEITLSSLCPQGDHVPSALELPYEHEISMPRRDPKPIPWLRLSFGIIITGISGTLGAHIDANVRVCAFSGNWSKRVSRHAKRNDLRR